MEVFIGILIGMVATVVIIWKVFGSSKESSSLDSISSRGSDERALVLIRIVEDFLLKYGIYDFASIALLSASMNNGKIDSDTMIQFVRDHESKMPLSEEEFRFVVEKNAKRFSESFPAPTKTFYALLSQFTDIRISALWHLNLKYNYFDGRKYGIRSLNYAVVAFSLYCYGLYIDLGHDFPYEDEKRLITFGKEQGFLRGDDDLWFCPDFFRIIRSVFRISLTLEESENAEIITKKIEAL